MDEHNHLITSGAEICQYLYFNSQFQKSERCSNICLFWCYGSKWLHQLFSSGTDKGLKGVLLSARSSKHPPHTHILFTDLIDTPSSHLLPLNPQETGGVSLFWQFCPVNRCSLKSNCYVLMCFCFLNLMSTIKMYSLSLWTFKAFWPKILISVRFPL